MPRGSKKDRQIRHIKKSERKLHPSYGKKKLNHIAYGHVNKHNKSVHKKKVSVSATLSDALKKTTQVINKEDTEKAIGPDAYKAIENTIDKEFKTKHIDENKMYASGSGSSRDKGLWIIDGKLVWVD